MRIYTGQIRNMYVKNVEINGSNVRVVTDSIVLKKKAPFYPNFVGRQISFEYGTFLPTQNEAIAYIEESVKRHPESADSVTCMYACYDSLTPQDLSKSEFKLLKKTWKDIRRLKKKSS